MDAKDVAENVARKFRQNHFTMDKASLIDAWNVVPLLKIVIRYDMKT